MVTQGALGYLGRLGHLIRNCWNKLRAAVMDPMTDNRNDWARSSWWYYARTCLDLQQEEIDGIWEHARKIACQDVRVVPANLATLLQSLRRPLGRAALTGNPSWATEFQATQLALLRCGEQWRAEVSHSPWFDRETGRWDAYVDWNNPLGPLQEVEESDDEDGFPPCRRHSLCRWDDRDGGDLPFCIRAAPFRVSFNVRITYIE